MFKLSFKLVLIELCLFHSFTTYAEIGTSESSYTNGGFNNNRNTVKDQNIERANIDLVSINKKCFKNSDRSHCLLGSTIGATYVNSPQRLKQLRDIYDVEELKKNAIAFCAIGGKDETFVTKSAKNSVARSNINPVFLSACLAMVDEEIKKILLNY